MKGKVSKVKVALTRRHQDHYDTINLVIYLITWKFSSEKGAEMFSNQQIQYLYFAYIFQFTEFIHQSPLWRM